MTKNPIDESLSTQFDNMVCEFTQLVREGKSPDIDEFANRNKDLAHRVQRLFPVLELMEQRNDSWDWSEVDQPEGTNTASKEISEGWKVPERLGDYRLIRQIGSGGMGVVYEAEQESLGRRVAIKILPTSAQFDERRVERFATEAKASAILHHTNIVPVFGIGCEDGFSFFVMQYINGQPLSRILRDVAQLRDHSTRKIGGEGLTDPNRNIALSLFGDSSPGSRIDRSTTTESLSRLPKRGKEGPDSDPSNSSDNSDSQTLVHPSDSDATGSRVRNYFINVAQIGVRVSEALDHAHSHGILHRDIKPSNLMLDDQLSVWVTDFGLAKSFDSPDITQTGEVIGTLRYMSPEQLSGKASDSSDIFGLGLTLYEMLTLQAAYPGVDRKRLVERVAEANPVNPRSIDSRIPRDLETIVMKCVQSEPSKRYASAAEVAEDLNRFLEGEPILARRISPIEKSWKWCCRRPTLAASLAALMLSILFGVAGIGWQYSNTVDALSKAQTETVKAQFATQEAQSAKGEANKNYGLARGAVVHLTESISNEELLTSPDLLPVRKKLLLKALQYQIKFVDRRPEDIDVRLELAEAYMNLASVSNQLAQTQEAELYLADSRKLLDSITRNSLSPSDSERATICRADIYALTGEIALRISTDGQSSLYKAVETLLNDREESELSNDELLRLSEYHSKLGDSYNNQNLGLRRPIRTVTESAKEHYTKSYEFTKAAIQSGNVAEFEQSKLAENMRKLGSVNRRLGDHELAFEYYTAAVEKYRELVESDEENTDYRFGLARALGSMAYFHDYSRRDAATAFEYYSKAIAEHQLLTNKYPSVPKFSEGETRTTMNYCNAYERNNESKKALPLRERTLKLFEKDLLFAPEDPSLLSSYGKALTGMGLNHARRRQRSEAIEYYTAAEEQHVVAMSRVPQSSTYRTRLARSIVLRGDVYKVQENYPLAHKTYFEAYKKTKPDVDAMYLAGRALLRLALEMKGNEDNLDDPDLIAKALASAKVVFREQAASEHKTTEKITGDKRLRIFAKSDMGSAFLDWLENVEHRYAEVRPGDESKKR